MAAAQERVQAAAVDSGWVITAVFPGVITVGPYKVKRYPVQTLTIHANIIASGDTAARVVVSGTSTDEYGRAIGRAIAGRQGESTAEGAPVLEATAGSGIFAWQELERFAAAILAR